MYETDQEAAGIGSKAPRPHKGDVNEAVMLLRDSVGALDEAIDLLRKRLDPIMLELPEGPTSVDKKPQSRSPLADEIHLELIRMRAQRARIEHFELQIQI